MDYTLDGWTLYCREIRFYEGNVKGPVRKIYFYSKKKPVSGTPCDMPEGYEVTFNKKTGMPLLKKK